MEDIVEEGSEFGVGLRVDIKWVAQLLPDGRRERVSGEWVLAKGIARKVLYLQREGPDVWVGVLIDGFNNVWQEPIREYDISAFEVLTCAFAAPSGL